MFKPVRNAAQAKETRRYWKLQVRSWEREKQLMMTAIAGLEDQDLAICVAAVADGIAEGSGAIVFAANKKKGLVTSSTIDLDEDLTEVLVSAYGEETADAAGRWLLTYLNGQSLGFVAWAFRHLKVPGDGVMKAERIVYGIKEQTIVGVMQQDGAAMVPYNRL